MDFKKYTNMNREAWNEAMPYHKRGREVSLEEAFKDPNYNVLDPIEKEILLRIGLEGKDVVHLCCNNGIELISIIRLGANLGVGYDISDEAIKEAKVLSKVAGVNCKFIQSDVYDLDPKNTGTFDLLYISVGALSWLPDIPRFFEIAASMLKPNGLIFIYEMHPFTDILGCEGEDGYQKEYPLNPLYSYFKEDPWIDTDGIDYIGGTVYKSKPIAEFSHTISSILNSLIKAGIEICEFNEYSHDISTGFKDIEKDKIVPLSYILIGKKK